MAAVLQRAADHLNDDGAQNAIQSMFQDWIEIKE